MTSSSKILSFLLSRLSFDHVYHPANTTGTATNPQHRLPFWFFILSPRALEGLAIRN